MSTSTNLALMAMTSPTNLRRVLCNYLETDFANAPLRMLGNLSPVDWFRVRYIENEAGFRDSNWKCHIGSAPHRNHQSVTSFSEYIQAMKQPSAQGDLLTLATFQSLFQLRVIVASSTILNHFTMTLFHRHLFAGTCL
jgi:hypothetical protein